MTVRVAALLGGVVQSLEGDGRAERAVADDGDHVADAATAVETAHHVAGLGQTAGQRDRGAGVAEHELVVFALLGVREAGHLVVPVGIEIGLGAAGEHLVHIALVRDVEDDAVAGRVEDAVERHGELDHPQVGPDMPPMGLAVGDERGTDIGAQLREFGGVQASRASSRDPIRPNSSPFMHTLLLPMSTGEIVDDVAGKDTQRPEMSPSSPYQEVSGVSCRMGVPRARMARRPAVIHICRRPSRLRAAAVSVGCSPRPGGLVVRAQWQVEPSAVVRSADEGRNRRRNQL